MVPPQNIFAIIGHEAEKVRAALAATGIGFVLQSEQRGTGHAMMQAREALQSFDMCSCCPAMFRSSHRKRLPGLRDFHSANDAAMTILTAEPPDPTGYGRMFRRSPMAKRLTKSNASLSRSRCAAARRQQREINSGIYAFATEPLYAHIDRARHQTMPTMSST